MRRISGLLQAGDFPAAHDQLQAIVEEHPDYAEARRLLGGAKLALGDATGAERTLREAISLDPAWTPTLATLGEMLLHGGRYEEAEQLLQQAVAGTPPSPHAALVLTRYYNDRQRSAQALAVVAPFCVTGNAFPELAAQHVVALVALGRKDDALTCYRRIVANSPDNVAAAHALAIALQASNQHEEAERIVGRALTQEHRSAALHYTHARSLIALGAFDRAETDLRDCLRLDPRRVDAHGDLARLVWMRTGDTVQATEMLDQALRTFANDDALWAAKVAVLQGAGDPRAAHACLAPRVERPQSPPALLVRAGLAALEFDPRIALDLAGRALHALPADASARKLIAAAYLGVGDAGAALPECEALLELTPDDQYLIALQTTAWRMLGDARYTRLCDYRNLVVPYQLETPSPWHNLPEFFADLKRSLGKLHSVYKHPLLFQSLRHGTETTEDLTDSEDPAIQALFRAFDAPIRDYIARMGEGADPLRR
ncbi:MAG: tetratricopeptide repeat protein, partial [Rhodanobacteraceae bacterium]